MRGEAYPPDELCGLLVVLVEQAAVVAPRRADGAALFPDAAVELAITLCAPEGNPSCVGPPGGRATGRGA